MIALVQVTLLMFRLLLYFMEKTMHRIQLSFLLKIVNYFDEIQEMYLLSG